MISLLDLALFAALLGCVWLVFTGFAGEMASGSPAGGGCGRVLLGLAGAIAALVAMVLL